MFFDKQIKKQTLMGIWCSFEKILFQDEVVEHLDRFELILHYREKN